MTEGWLTVIETYALHRLMYDYVFSLTVQHISIHVCRCSSFPALAFLGRHLHSSLSSAGLLHPLIRSILQNIHCVLISRDVRANISLATVYLLYQSICTVCHGVVYSTTYTVNPQGSDVLENRRVHRTVYNGQYIIRINLKYSYFKQILKN